MPRLSDEPLHKHTLLLFEGDYNRLQEIYPEVGAAVIIRQLVRGHIKKFEKSTDPSTVKLQDFDL